MYCSLCHGAHACVIATMHACAHGGRVHVQTFSAYSSFLLSIHCLLLLEDILSILHFETLTEKEHNFPGVIVHAHIILEVVVESMSHKMCDNLALC